MPRRTEKASGPEWEDVRSYDRPDVPLPEWEGDWNSHLPVDLTGREIQPGDWVVKHFASGRATNIEVRQVREVRPVKSRSSFDEEWGAGRHKPVGMMRVYLGDSRTPVDYPGRMLIVPWDENVGRIVGLDT